MRKTKHSRVLALVLALVMVLSMLPVPAFAAETATWTKVDAADITADDTIAVTMTNPNGVTYALYTVQSGTKGNEAKVVTVDGDNLTTDGTADYGWTVTPVDGGYTLSVDAGYLYTTDANNGVRIGDTEAVWAIDGNYLSTTDTSGNTRWLGVYDNNNGDYSAVATPNWRAYKNTTGNTAGQTLGFWKLTDTSETPDPTDPVDPTDPTDPVELPAYTLTDTLASGDVVLVYNAGSGTILTSTPSGYKLAGENAEVVENVISTDLAAAAWTVGVNDDGTYTFSQGALQLGMVQSGSYVNLSTNAADGYTAWTLENGSADATYYLRNTNMPAGNYGPYYLEYYSGYTAYASNSPSDSAYGIQFFKLPVSQDFVLRDTLSAGAEVVLYNPGSTSALTSTPSGYKLAGETVTPENNAIVTENETLIWTVGVSGDGTYTFSQGELVLGMVQSGSYINLSTNAADGYTAWTVEDGSGEGVHYLRNTNMPAGNYGPYYLEYYSGFTAYASNSPSDSAYGIQFYVRGGSETPEPEVTLPQEGQQVVLYNLAAQGVLASENDTQSIENALTTVENGVATPGNGGVVFTVEANGDYYRFYNETYGYLCSNGTGNNAFYATEASEDADWTLVEGKSGGWNMESRTAKYNGVYSQYLEYYADSYKTYSMYNVTDYDIYEFFFFPVAEGLNLTGSIVNVPDVVFGAVENAYLGQDYTYTFRVDAIFGVDTLTVTVNGAEAAYTEENGVYTVVITAAQIREIFDAWTNDGVPSFGISISGTDATGTAFANGSVIDIIDEPSIGEVSPAANAQTGDDKRPSISAFVFNGGFDGTTAAMTVNGTAVEVTYYVIEDGSGNGIVTWTPAEDLPDGRTTVTVTVTRADGKTASKSWSFLVGEAQYELYFGQLHSHTTYSDGSGSLESALDYVASLPEDANVDFVAFTDHSNYFDTSSAANPEQALYDMSLASADSQKLWSAYKSAIADFNAEQSGVIALGGFEMTWSGGPGHINTFATPGIVSRNNSTLNNKTSDAGMKAYYALISQTEGVDSISQFNHPGTTFGNFSDFAYWDALVDTRMYLVEVGNGEGQVGAGGYYPSYEQYTMALDKGWHVAPTNNQDNHKGKWGNANDARDVILTDDFSEEGIYEAIRSYRVYATEDKNLELGYTVNGKVLGSIIEEVPEVLNVEVTAYDPDSSDSLSKVEVIVNSGKVAYLWDDPAVLATGTLTATLAPDYSYYYIRVTQGDGDIAVTAPVWVGETLKLGISAVECGTSTPVTGEELTITTTLFNSEVSDATVKSLTYTVGDLVLGVDTTGYSIPASGSTSVDFLYTPEVAKVMNVTVTVVVELDGVEYTFSMDVELDVQDASKLVYIGIDASHYNEYVSGNYKDSMGNFGELAAGYSVRTVTLATSEDLIAACGNDKYTALILTAPSRRLAAAQEALLTYTDAEVEAIKAFNANGGTVILAGWSDNYENYDAVAGMTAQQHMAATQNALLEALGSSLRITDDATHDNELNGGQTQRLYFNAYNYDSFLLDGVEMDPANPNDRLYTEVYSQYGGATIHVVDENGSMTSEIPETVTPIVFGHSSTYSKDTDGDGIGGDGVPKYAYAKNDDRLMVLASEELEGQGLIIVAGAAFMSNFEVQATIEDSGSEKNYSNYKICENLVQYLNPVTVTDIASVQAQTEEGVKYTIEGVVTSNASGFDKDTAFFDCIYLQDETAGINAFPVAGNYKIGDKVRITGTTSSYQGERQIAVTKIELISEGNTVEPTGITAAQLNDGSVLGSLVTLKGIVESYEYANGLIQTIMVKDADGNVGRVFIDGYITTSYDVENLDVGAYVVVTGLASYDNSFDGPAPRIRIRDRHDVRVTVNPNGFEDVKPEHWFYDAVSAVVEAGIMKGATETLFNPEGTLTRAEWVTMLYRAAGSPAVEEPSTFADVPADMFFADAFAWAEDMGIVSGVGGGMGAPYATITREQMVTMLYRYDGQNWTEFDLSGFSDVDTVSYYAFDAFEWAVSNGYVNGMTATTLAPQATTNRAQAATILARYLGLI